MSELVLRMIVLPLPQYASAKVLESSLWFIPKQRHEMKVEGNVS